MRTLKLSKKRKGMVGLCLAILMGGVGAARAQGNGPTADIILHPSATHISISDAISLPDAGSIKVLLEVTKAGKSGRANTRQSKMIRANAGQIYHCSNINLSWQAGDHLQATLSLYVDDILVLSTQQNYAFGEPTPNVSSPL